MLLLACALGSAQAGSFMVDPTRIELAPGRLSATLTIRNDDSEPAVIRVEARSWAQSGGEDQYQSSREILVSPPIMTIAPGGEQIVRIALRRPLDPLKELSYRIFLQEVPSAPRPGFSGLQVALRISLPVFVAPASGAAPKAAWNVAYLAREHALRVGLANAGNAHLQLQEFKLSAPGSSATLALQQTSAYLLPGQRRDWLIKLDPAQRIAGDRLRLRAKTDGGEMEQELEIDSQP
jgi:fimbrial chaperone protein